MRSLLTLPGVFGDSGVPQTVIGVTDAFPVPHTAEKSSHICFCQQAARGVSSGWFRYWRDSGGLSQAGERCFRLFLCSNPKTVRFLCSISSFPTVGGAHE